MRRMPIVLAIFLMIGGIVFAPTVGRSQDPIPPDEPTTNPDTDIAGEDPARLGDVVVSATRSPADPADVPGSVTVIDREALDRESTLSPGLGGILGSQVPGMSPPTGTLSSFGQTLRGRDFLVLIDGVPQSTPLREASRDLETIDPASIERIEVIRGSTAIYGYGGAGGIVNIITKPAGEGPWRQQTEAQVGFSEHDLDDSLMGHLSHQASGGVGSHRFRFNGLIGQTDAFFDGMGDRIPPDPHGQGGFSEARRLDFSGRWTYELDEGRSVGLAAQYYENFQDRDVRKVLGVPGRRKTSTTDGEPTVVEDPGTENANVRLTLRDPELLGHRARMQLYMQDYKTRFDTSPFFGSQSFVDTQKRGGRLDLHRRLRWGGLPPIQTHWGVDYLRDETKQADEAGRLVTPLMEQSSWAPFLQLEVPVGSDWVLRGGVRHEELTLDVEDFVIHPAFRAFLPPGSGTVEGGSLDYDETVFNLGAGWHLSPAWNLKGSFSQGFSVGDVGRLLRFTTASSVEALDPEAQVVDSYELGVHRSGRRLDASLVGFFNESDLGTSFDRNLRLLRQPEKVYGLEASLDHRYSTVWGYGAQLTWMEGKTDPDDDGSYEEYLDGTRIPPFKAHGYLRHRTTPWWTNRLQVQYWGSRDRFPDATIGDFGKGEVENQALLDIHSRFQLARGSLEVGVQNLLDEFYFPPISEAWNFDGSGYTAGPGRTVRLTYRIRW